MSEVPLYRRKTPAHGSETAVTLAAERPGQEGESLVN